MEEQEDDWLSSNEEQLPIDDDDCNTSDSGEDSDSDVEEEPTELPPIFPTELPPIFLNKVFDEKKDAVKAVKAHSAAIGKSIVQKTDYKNNSAVAFICCDRVDKDATKEYRATYKQQNDKDSKHQVLKEVGCTFEAVIRKIGNKGKGGDTSVGNKWHVTTFQPHVNCGGQLSLSADNIAAAVYSNVESNRGISGDDIATLVRKAHPTAKAPTRRQCYRARTNVIDKLDMHYNDSFSLLKLWGDEVVHCNPGTIFEYKTRTWPSGQKEFVSAAMALPLASLEKACLPVSGLDGTHSRHHIYNGVYLTFTLLTSEGTTLMVAWAVVTTESEDTWKWFLEILRKAGLDVFLKSDKVVITDRDKGLLKTVHNTLDVFHFKCTWHLLRNVYKHCNCFNETTMGIRPLFWKVVKSWTRASFEHNMESLKEKNSKAHDYLSKIPPCSWTIMGAHEGGIGLQGRLTSQFAESENAASAKTKNSARFLPPLFFFVESLQRVHSRLAMLRERLATGTNTLTDRATKKLQYFINESAGMDVRWTSDKRSAPLFALMALYAL